MPITLGDFFKSAPFARPVNPRPITFTANCRDDILPSGEKNPHGAPVSAAVTAAMVFLGGDQTQHALADARKHLHDQNERLKDPKAAAPGEDFYNDLDLEFMYQAMWRCMFEWDESNRRICNRIFHSVDLLRAMVVPREIGRMWKLYSDYVAEEHPEVIDQDSFRVPKGASGAVAGKIPGR